MFASKHSSTDVHRPPDEFCTQKIAGAVSKHHRSDWRYAISGRQCVSVNSRDTVSSSEKQAVAGFARIVKYNFSSKADCSVLSVK